MIYLSTALIFIIVASYILYPLFVWAIANLQPGKALTFKSADGTPINVLITVHNGEKNIKARLDNILHVFTKTNQSNLNLFVASDGSTDQTEDLVENYGADIVRLIKCKEKPGKTSAQLQALEEITDGIVVFTDVNTVFKENFLEEIIKVFDDPDIGGVTGNLQLKVSKSGLNLAQRLHWYFETVSRKAESSLGLLSTGAGACMAVRRRCISPWRSNIGEDCELPLQVVSQNQKFVFAENAIAYDKFADNFEQEFKARIRMTVRNLDGTIPYLLEFLKNFRFNLCLSIFVHKIVRWLSPIFLILLLISSLATPKYVISEVILLLFLSCFCVAAFHRVISLGRAGALCYSFIMVNLAFLIGIVKYLNQEKIDRYTD